MGGKCENCDITVWRILESFCKNKINADRRNEPFCVSAHVTFNRSSLFSFVRDVAGRKSGYFLLLLLQILLYYGD